MNEHDIPTVLRSITARRAQVLRELTEGYTNPEIAERLGISVASVRSHIETLRKYTHCTSRGDLMRWWSRHRDDWLAMMKKDAGLG